MISFPRLAIIFGVCIGLSSTWAMSQQLSCNPCSHGYGRTLIGTTKTYNFQLSNTGTKTLHILSKSKKGAPFSFVSFPLPVTLKPGRAVTMTIAFSPTTAGKTMGSIALTSDATNSKLTLGVWGTGVTANSATLVVSPTQLNFGNVTVGNQLSMPLTLTASNGAVTISSLTISEPEFTVTGLTLPQTIASGQSISVTVVFKPTISGTASGQLTLKSDAGNSPTSVAVTGTGIIAGSHSTDLSWNASVDPVIGYNIYRGTTRGGPYGKVNDVLDSATTYTDTGVHAGATYFYVVTAVAADSHESAYSNEVKVVIPTP